MTITIIELNGHWHMHGTLWGQRVRRSTGLLALPKYRPAAERMRRDAMEEIIKSKAGRDWIWRKIEAQAARAAGGERINLSTGLPAEKRFRRYAELITRTIEQVAMEQVAAGDQRRL